MVHLIDLLKGKIEESASAIHELAGKSRRLFGQRHYFTLGALMLQIISQLQGGAAAEAAVLADELLASAERTLGAENVAMVETMEIIANVYMTTGRLEEARTLLGRSLLLYSCCHGDHHTLTMGVKGSLGLLHSEVGDLDDAAMLLEDVLAHQKRTCGDDDPDVMNTQCNLGNVYLQQHRYDAGIEMMETSLDTCQQVYGDRHPTTLNHMSNLANGLDQIGSPKAEAMAQDVLTMRRRILGDEHPDTLLSMQNIGTVLFKQGDFKAAELLLVEAEAGYT
jgi:tetratricopeptide (TPR) repeat protein